MFHEGNLVLALSSDTRSAACRRVKPEISSTIRPILGSTGGAVEDGEASAVVASHLDRPVRETSLAWTASEDIVRRCGRRGRTVVQAATEKPEECIDNGSTLVY